MDWEDCPVTTGQRETVTKSHQTRQTLMGYQRGLYLNH